MSQWKGKTNAHILGIRIFVFVLNHLSLTFAYFILRFVAGYYFLFAWKSNRCSYFYFHRILKFSSVVSLAKMYRNYYIFGQTLLDKVAVLSGAKANFSVEHEGVEILDEMTRKGKGGILISAHIGNWEMAGQLLNRLNTKFNILVYENEHENIKLFLDTVQKKKSVNIISIREGDLGHIIEINNAFKNNELLVMHGDRFRDLAPTVSMPFFGKIAKFPKGPFYMAAKFGVPVSYVFALKETNTKYHFYASELIEVKRTRKEFESEETGKQLLKSYIDHLEKIVKIYPEQWFNYYPFWNDQQIKK